MAAPARASEFTCKPDGFSLDHFGSLWRLTGALEVPTPGYAYEFQPPKTARSDLLQVPLKLTPPDGIAPAMIAKLPVQYSFTADDLLRLTVSINRDFNWGPDVIDCYIPKKPYQ